MSLLLRIRKTVFKVHTYFPIWKHGLLLTRCIYFELKEMANFAKSDFLCTKAALARTFAKSSTCIVHESTLYFFIFLLYSPQDSSSGWLLQRQMVEFSNFLACEVHCIFIAAGTLFYKNLRQQVCFASNITA